MSFPRAPTSKCDTLCPPEYPVSCVRNSERGRIGRPCVQQKEHCDLSKEEIRETPSLPRPLSIPEIHWFELRGAKRDPKRVLHFPARCNRNPTQTVRAEVDIDALHNYLWLESQFGVDMPFVNDYSVQIHLSLADRARIQRAWVALDPERRAQGYLLNTEENQQWRDPLIPKSSDLPVQGNISCINAKDVDAISFVDVETLHEQGLVVRLWDTKQHVMRCYNILTLFAWVQQRRSQGLPVTFPETNQPIPEHVVQRVQRRFIVASYHLLSPFLTLYKLVVQRAGLDGTKHIVVIRNVREQKEDDQRQNDWWPQVVDTFTEMLEVPNRTYGQNTERESANVTRASSADGSKTVHFLTLSRPRTFSDLTFQLYVRMNWGNEFYRDLSRYEAYMEANAHVWDLLVFAPHAEKQRLQTLVTRIPHTLNIGVSLRCKNVYTCEKRPFSQPNLDFFVAGDMERLQSIDTTQFVNTWDSNVWGAKHDWMERIKIAETVKGNNMLDYAIRFTSQNNTN